MPGYEEVNFEADPKPLIDASKQANRALEDFEKKAEQSAAGAQKAFDQTADGMLRTSQRSSSSIARIVEAQERAASRDRNRGNPLAALEAERQLNVRRVEGDARAVERLNAAYQARAEVIKQTQTAESLRAAQAASRRADQAGEEFQRALAANNARIREQVAERQKIVASLERQAAGATGGRSGQLRFDLQNTLSNLRGIGASADEINRATAAYQKMIGAAEKAEKAQGSFVSSAVANVRRFAAVYASLALIIAGVGGAIQSSIDLADQSRKTEIFFTKTFNSATQARKSLLEIRDIARDSSVFDIRSAAEGAKQLAAFGFNAQQIPQFLRGIGDAAAVLGEDRIQRVTIALGQIATKGRVQSQELLQLQEAGISATEILSRGFNRNTADLLKLVENGVVPAKAALDLLLSGIQEKFGGIDKQFNSTATGIQNQIKQNFQEIGIEIGRIFDEPIKTSLRDFNDFLTSAKGFLSEVKALTAESGNGPSFRLAGGQFATPGNSSKAAAAEFLQREREADIEYEKNITFLRKDGLKVLGDMNRTRFQGNKDAQITAVFAQRELADSIAIGKAEKEREKAQKEAVRNAERLREILAELRDDRSAAIIGFKAPTTAIERLNVKLADTKRKLADVGAGPAAQREAALLIKQTFAVEQGADSRRKATKERQEQTEKVFEQGAKELDLIDKLFEANAKLNEQVFDRTDRLFKESLQEEEQNVLAAVDRQRRIRFANVDAVNRKDVAGQIQSVQERLKIEIDYLNEKTRLELDQIERRRAEELRQLQDARTLLIARGGNTATVDAQIRTVQAIFDAKTKAKQAEIVDEKVLLESDAAQQISKIQIDAQQRVFDEWKDAFSRTIDAATVRFRGWGEFMKSMIQAFLIAPAKEFGAVLFASLATGQSLSRQLAAGGAGGGRSLGLFGTLLGGGNGGFGPQLGSASTPGGTGTFTGQPIPGLSSSGRGGLLGNVSNFGGGFKGFLTALGNIGRGGKQVPGTPPAGVGGLTGGALLLGGGILAADGIRRRSLLGAAEAGVGGALIGLKFGGPIGAAIGAGIGFGAGLIASLFKKGEDKARELIKQVYGVEIREKNILKLFLDLAKGSFGGDLRLALYSEQARELIQTYKLSQGDRSGLAGATSGPRALSLLQSGGVLSRVTLPGSTGGALLSPSATAPAQVVQVVQVTLDGQATRDVIDGQTIVSIGRNARAVATSAANGQAGSFGRGPFNALEPGTLFG